MTVSGFDFTERDLFSVVEQSINNLAGLFRREKPVAGERNHQRGGFHSGKGGIQIAAVFGSYIEVIGCPGDVKVTVGIEAFNKALSLILQITFHSEIKVELEIKFRFILQSSAEFSAERFFRQICVERIDNLRPEQTKRFTVLMWLEGEDPECIDKLFGSKIKIEMNFSVEEFE